MSFLTKILTKSITKVIKDLTKFEIVIDDLIDKFKESCPPKDELLKIVQQKNQIQSALSTVTESFNTVESTAQTTETLVTSVSTAVNVIKLIPIPTSVPPGVGIPINVITILADSLDTLGKVLDGAKGAISVVPKATDTIGDAAFAILSKLEQLDGVLNKCIEELAEGLNQNEKNDLINEIGNVAATSGTFTNIDLNLLNEDELLSRLDPNSDNPFRYTRRPTIFIPFEDQSVTDVEGGRDGLDSGTVTVNGKRGYYAGNDWLLTIEYNANNEFSFPQRRIKAINDNFDKNNIFKGAVKYNQEFGVYSYSTSVKVLVDEMKFVIDNLNTGWWRNKLRKEQMTEVQINQGLSGIGSSATTGGGTSQGGSSSNTGGSTSTSSSPPPTPIRITPTSGQTYAFATEIELPLPTGGNNTFNKLRTVEITTTVPSQSVKLIIDTGGEEVYNTGAGEFGGGFGGFGTQGEFGSYIQGEVTVKTNTALGTINNRVQSTTADRESREKIFTYDNIGTYTFRYEVTDIQDIIVGMGGSIKLEIV